MIGAMKMPARFKYKKAALAGRPQHEKYDDFWRKHTPMDQSHRAKQFAPFDALDGFDEGIAAKEILYKPRKAVDPDFLNEKLTRLSGCDSPVSITYFVPCDDPDNDAFDCGEGTYYTITGNVRAIDCVTKTLRIGDLMVSFGDIAEIEFETESPSFSFVCPSTGGHFHSGVLRQEHFLTMT